MKKIYCLLLSLLILLSLTACGGSSSSSIRSPSNDALFSSGSQSFSNTRALAEESYDGMSSFVEADREASIVRDYAMIVRTADLSVDVTDLNEFAANLERRVQEVGGYFEQNDIENYSSAYSTDRCQLPD